MKFLLGKSTDAAYNLAMEEYVLSNCRNDDYFILWINKPSIIIGKFQNVYQEVDVKEAFLQNIPIYRRISGGGCVYHDEGNLNFSFITDWKMEENAYSRFLNPMIDVLREYRIPVYQNGICNLAIDGKKISGNAQTIYKKRILHHGTLLFDTDLNRIRNIIKPDYEHYISKAMRSVNMPVMNISEYRGCMIEDIEELKQVILKGMGYRPENEFEISKEAQKEIENIRRDKYCTWEWNYAKAADFEYCRYFHNPGGSIRYKVENAVLNDIRIEHNDMTCEKCRFLENRLRQKRFSYPNIHGILTQYDIDGEMIEDFLFGAKAEI